MAAGHAVIYKRDSRSASIWVLVIWLLPAVGARALPADGHQPRAAPRRAPAPRHGAPSHRAADPRRASRAATSRRSRGSSARWSKRPLARRQLDRGAGRRRGGLPGDARGDRVGARLDRARLLHLQRRRHRRRSSSRRSSARTKRGVAVRVLVDDVDARFSRVLGVQAAAPRRHPGRRLQPADRAGAAQRHSTCATTARSWSSTARSASPAG